MITVHQLPYNPFSENTYVLADSQNNAIIIDPGMYFPQEQSHLFEFLNHHKLKPVHLWLTHAHLDHVFGVNWVYKTYNLVPQLEADDLFIYESAVATANQYGLSMDPLVDCQTSFNDGDMLSVDNTELEVIKAPGHSPGSICFYCKRDGFIISGDVLFQGSIGRTDLPGGSFDQLITSIRSRLLTLPDDVTVYSGHGPATTIGQERQSNPFLIQ